MSKVIAQAAELYRSNRHAEAANLLLAEDAATPLSLQALLLLAQSKTKLGEAEAAAHLFARAADDPQADRKLMLSLALSLMLKADRARDAFDYAKALLALDPQNADAAAVYRHCLHRRLDVDEARVSNASLRAALAAGDAFAAAIENPLENLYWCGDEALNRAVTRMQGGKPYREEDRLRRRARPHVFGARPRVGYLSNDLSDCHATIQLLQGVLDFHDPEAIDFTLFCYTPQALKRADQGFRQRHAGRIVDLKDLSTEDAHRLIRAQGVDILVDLKGHTGGAWIDLVNSGPAPIQVAYLGFPGSARGIDCDYILSDAVVTPPSSRPYYHEAFCLLPESYQPNDMVYRPLPPPLSRAALGLPEDRLVFSSVNTIRKITPETFDLWMRVLKAVPDSLLYLLGGDDGANARFLGAVSRAGVDTSRIVFRPTLSHLDHLAALPASDLALDTFPCSGHTTTSEQLWMGLPVLTRQGSNFASRVSESLLRAVGLPELVAHDEENFVARAVQLAQNGQKRLEIREKLRRNRRLMPLFDSERMARHLEKAFSMMIERARQGLEPADFAVPAEPPRSTPFSIGERASPAQA